MQYMCHRRRPQRGYGTGGYVTAPWTRRRRRTV